ncbi:MAG: hypothetical protein JJE03_05215 [Peptostreptococcaceae bacterium]|nr:hypothetical protein [Peptostreptococcaceae bacterium]
MSLVYISELAHDCTKKYIRDKGHRIIEIPENNYVLRAISSHPDIFMCKMGCKSDSPIIYSDEFKFLMGSKTPYEDFKFSLGPKYPNDVVYNAAATGKYLIHCLRYTDGKIISAAKKLRLHLIDIPQGYAKCSIIVVNEENIITYDRGISRKIYTDYFPNSPTILQINPGHVTLPGMRVGFLGGASGRLGDEIIFNGDLNEHPDALKIKAYIESRGLKCVWFNDYPLVDIGTIIEEGRVQ